MTLYTIGCPKCTILEKKINEKGIKYEICEDTGTMINKGIDELPVLEMDGKLMNFKEAVDYVNTL